VIKKTALLGLGSLLILVLAACGEPGVKVAEEKANSSGGNVNVATTETDAAEQDSDGESNSDDAAEGDGSASSSDATGGTTAEPAPSTDDDDNDSGDDESEVATIASLVGFYVTKSAGDASNYAGITPDGVLTDHIPTTTQITDRGNGVFWVQNGDVQYQIRLAVQDGNLILFRNDINEPERIVYPASTSVSLSDLTICG